ncbi:MAG: hypothetical protein Q9213_001515 [Squamulea squamosa]
MEQQLRNRLRASHFQAAVINSPFRILLSTVQSTTRAKYVQAMLAANSFDALTSAAAVARDLLYMSPYDKRDVKQVLPVLYLRLGRDQEAYNFVNWCIPKGRRSYHNWTNFHPPYPKIVDADAFESPPATTATDNDLLNLVCMTLLKIRLLLDIKALQQTQQLSVKLPQELVDMVKELLPATDVVRNSRKIIRSRDYTSVIRDLSRQVGQCIQTVTQVNPDFWPTLVCHAGFRSPRETYVSPTDPVHLTLHNCGDAWRENPQAIDVIKALYLRYLDS